MPIRICATRSGEPLADELKSERSFSMSGVEPVRQRDEDVLSLPVPSDLPPLRGCVAAAVLGRTTWTMSHSKASCFSCLLAFLELSDGGVCALTHSRISARTALLYESLSSHRTKRTLR